MEVRLKTSHSSRTPRIMSKGYGGRMKGRGGRWRKEEERVRLKRKRKWEQNTNRISSYTKGCRESWPEGLKPSYGWAWAPLVAQLIKESAFNAGDPSLIPGLGRSPGKGIGYPLWCLWASLVAQMVRNLPAMRDIWD